MVCLRPRTFGTACWLRSTVPTRWRCRSPGSMPPAWLATELERLGDPVDLVGHDWGGGFVVRLVSTRPELVRSWVTDAAGIGDVEFEWHDFAKIWQTPQAGEDFFAQQLAASTQERAGVFQMFGCPRSRPSTWHRTSTAP